LGWFILVRFQSKDTELSATFAHHSPVIVGGGGGGGW
jgi:hypothetical protein